MLPRSVALVLGCAAALAGVTTAAHAHTAPPATKPQTIHVRSTAEFQAAERTLETSGGTIVLLPGHYRNLTLPPRGRAPLRIVGTRRVRVRYVLFDGARNVSLGGVRIGSSDGNSRVDVRKSRDILLHNLLVSAAGTRNWAYIRVPNSAGVTIRRSEFTRCGDRALTFTNCVELWRWSHRIVIEENHFHDCRGCDFVHGRFGTQLMIRRNRFERALPCSMSKHRCGHNDLVQLFRGRHLLVEANHFGVYREGGAQLYLTNRVDYATIVNNVFLGTDPKVPRYHARMGIVIGSAASKRLPRYAKIVNNTILTGTRRRDGYTGSIRMSSRYGTLERWIRPIVANNVIGVLEQPARVCNGSQLFLNNVVLQGRDCSRSLVQAGRAGLDGRGQPRRGSLVIDGANRQYAPRTDFTGRRRTGPPDIGAIEYRRK